MESWRVDAHHPPDHYHRAHYTSAEGRPGLVRLVSMDRQPAGQARFHVCKIRLVLFAPTSQRRRRYRDSDLRARDFEAPLWAPTRLCRTVLAETDPGRL